EDYRGGQREVDREVILGILDAMQIPARSEQQQRNSLAQLAEEGDQPPELLVGRCGRPLRLSGAFCRAAQGYGDLELEGGGHRRLAIEPQADGACLLAPLDQPGYHRLTVGGREIPLAMAPARPRPIPSAGETWGIAAQLYGLRREGDGG